MANVKISQLPAATLPMSGAELVPVVQAGITEKATVADFTTASAGYTPSGTGATARSVSAKLDEVVSVADFGAVGDGVTDDYAAVQAAIDHLVSRGGGLLYVPSGTYILSATVSVFNESVHIVGDGPFSTELRASHSSGPVLRIGYMYSAVKSIALNSTSARISGSASGNVGLLDMAADEVGTEVNGCFYDDLYVLNQPSHGIVMASHYKGSTIDRARIAVCAGHGIFLEDGTTYSRINKSQIGGVEIKHTRIFQCTGHAIAVGTSGTDYGYRIVIDNVDAFHCALTAGVRNSLHTFWIYSQNAEVKNSGIGGFAGSAPRVLTVGGVYINGRNARVINNRFIDVLGNAVTLGADSDGAVVEELQVTGDVIVALNPAVVVTSGATGVFCRTGDLSNITLLMTVAAANTGNHSEARGLIPTGYRSANQEVSLLDDTVTTISFSGVTRGILVLNGNSSTAKSAMFGFRCGDASAYCTLLTTATNVGTTTGVLTGTTGTDTNLTVSAGTAGDSTLYIENRRGFTGAYMYTFLSLANGEMNV